MRHPALIIEEGFLPPNKGGGEPGMPPLNPSQEGDMDIGPDKMAEEMGEQQGDDEYGEEPTPEMIAAGVKVLQQEEGNVAPEELVKAIYMAMCPMEKKEEIAEGEIPDDVMAGMMGSPV
jgi:hypothetical protein